MKVHLVSDQDYQRRIIWDVIGKVKGSDYPDDWVVVGNHRDAWVYGAVDPNSGTAAMLEAVHGVGALLKKGWRPKRTIVFCSWDAEEEGLIGSTEWVEQHMAQLNNAVAYFNVDVAVAGPDFSAAAVPSLKQFVRELTRQVPSPVGVRFTSSGGLSTTRRRSIAPLTRPPSTKAKCTWATLARGLTLRHSCSMPAFLQLTLDRKGLMACITRRSTITPGLPRMPTPILNICRRWRA